MISKQLKHVTFRYDFETKLLGIFVNNSSDFVSISRSEMLSLVRFILRIVQKGKGRKAIYGGTARTIYPKGNKGGTLKRGYLKKLYKSILEL